MCTNYHGCKRRCRCARNLTDNIAYMRTRRVLVNDLEAANNNGCGCSCGCCCECADDTSCNNADSAYDYGYGYDYGCGCDHSDTSVAEGSARYAELFNNCETCR
ncbi:MAG: hypothetical protein E7409_04810 [Ruminococcaceae bacterium]|nr:hypothetical protein [Oscillospiraceae bacterium]